MLLEVVENHPVAKRRRADVPLDGVTGGPAAEGLRADIQRSLYAAARVVPRAANTTQLPARAKVARAHFRIGFEAAAGKHDGFRGDVLVAARALDSNAADGTVARLQQVAHLGRVAHLDAPLLRAL